MENGNIQKLLTAAEVGQVTGYSRTQIWRKSNDPDDDFPAAIQLGPNRVAWFQHELESWLASRPRRCHGTAPEQVGSGAQAA